jgi:hypothetical protein
MKKGAWLSSIIAREDHSLTPFALTQSIVECGVRVIYLLLVVEFSNRCITCTKGRHNKGHFNRTIKSSRKSRKIDTAYKSPSFSITGWYM